MSRGLRCYRALLRLFPDQVSARDREAMLQLAGDLLRHSYTSGIAARSRLWSWLLADLAGALFREHREARRPRAGRPTRPPEPLMGILLQDLRYSLRALRRQPGFSVAVILSLALGIGGNTLIYSVVNGLVLRPFHYPDADRLVGIGVTFPRRGGEREFIETLSGPEYSDIAGNSHTLERFTALDLGNRNVSGGDRPDRVFTGFIWGDPFATIGLSPALGRGFTGAETLQPGPPVAIISWRLWQSRFGGDSGLVGRTIQVNGAATTVVGIMPRELLLIGTDLWLPMGGSPANRSRTGRQYSVIARLKPGVTAAQADADLGLTAAQVAKAYGAEQEEYTDWRLEVAPWARVLTGPMRTAGLVMLGAVGFVLLIACANISGMLLARAAGRRREIALRRALGASGARIMRQLLTESLVLSLAGGVLGTGLALLLLSPVATLFPSRVEFFGLAPAVDLRVLLVTLALAVSVGLLAGLAPALQLARRRDTAAVMREGGQVTTSRGGHRLRQGFAVVQIALALVLLTGAGVLLQSARKLQAVDPGFSTTGVLTMRLSLPWEKYNREGVARFFEELSDRLTGLPGVVSAGATTQFPPNNNFRSRLRLAGETADAAETRVVDVTNVSERFFGTLGYTLLRGRAFGATDDAKSPRVAVLNQTAALRLFPAGEAIGSRVLLGEAEDTVWREVVGVVADVRNHGLDAAPAPEVFVPVRQQDVAWNNQLFLLIRTRGRPLELLPSVRSTIATLDPDQPVYAIRTLDEAFADSVASRKAAMLVLTVFAAVALGLAGVGIYGLLSFLVTERTREIAIRMALGARADDVLGMTLRHLGVLVSLGLVLGLAGALALGRVLSNLLFEVSPADPLTLGLVAAVLAITGIVAGLHPARRATRVPAIEALRAE